MPTRNRQSAVILRLKRKKKPVDPREEPFNIAFGLRLRAAREESRLSQARLSERLGIGYHQYKKYEYGRPFPIYLLRDIASILDKPISWLLIGPLISTNVLAGLMLQFGRAGLYPIAARFFFVRNSDNLALTTC